MDILALVLLAVSKIQAAMADGKLTLQEAADLAFAELEAAGIMGNKVASLDPAIVAAIKKYVNFVLKSLNKGGDYKVSDVKEVVLRGLKKFKLGGLVLLKK